MTQKKTEKKYMYRMCCMLLFALIATVSFFWVWYRFARVNNQTRHLLGYANLLMSAGIYFILYILFGKALKAFRIGVDRKANLLASQVLTLFCTDGIETFVSCAITGQFRFFPNFLWRYALLFLCQGVVLCILVIPLVDIYRRIFPALQLLEVYGDEHDDNLLFMDGRPDKYHIAEKINYREGIENIYSKMSSYDAVLINDIPSEVKNDILKECFKQDKRVYFTPKISDIIEKTAEEINLFDTPLYLCRNSGLSKTQLYIKRFCDIVVSFIGIVITSPILIVTAIAIKLEDGGCGPRNIPVTQRYKSCPRYTHGHRLTYSSVTSMKFPRFQDALNK